MKTPKSIEAASRWLSLTADQTVARQETLEAWSRELCPAWQNFQEQTHIWRRLTLDGQPQGWYTLARFGIGGFDAARKMLTLMRVDNLDTSRCQTEFRLLWAVESGQDICFIDAEKHTVRPSVAWPHHIPSQFAIEQKEGE